MSSQPSFAVRCPQCGELNSRQAVRCAICQANLPQVAEFSATELSAVDDEALSSDAPVAAPPESGAPQTPRVRPGVWISLVLFAGVVLCTGGIVAWRVATEPQRASYERSTRVRITRFSQRPTQSTVQSSTNGAASSVDEQLHTAAANGDVENAKVLLQQGANPNATSKNGVPALASAAHRGYLPVVKLLLESGSDVNAKVVDRNPKGEAVGGQSALFLPPRKGTLRWRSCCWKKAPTYVWNR